MRAQRDAPDASMLWPPGGDAPDASMLGVACLNVGMMTAASFTRKPATQDAKIAELAENVIGWLAGGFAVVGLNEIHDSLAAKLVDECRRRGTLVERQTDDTNAMLWCIA